ncbi:AAA family ATPase [Nocardioides sp. R1-1]|uniref:AAA family ATPase n=1 Tax=Nocardioides sp. R1-1 TaxID=3383502 RepID=UPI0038D05B54
MARLLHLNGPPGIGKSTIARRYAAEHPGTLNCDIDVLRTLVGGWADDFVRAGSLIRPAALAMIEAYLASGQDVVLPQLLIDPAEIGLFEGCAARAQAQFVERLLMDAPDRAVARFHRRGADQPDDPWHAQVRAIVAAQGGDEAIHRRHAALQALAGSRPDAVVVESAEGDVEETYRRLLASLA